MAKNGVSQEYIGPLILEKIQMYILTRAELLYTLCYEIPCTTSVKLFVSSSGIVYVSGFFKENHPSPSFTPLNHFCLSLNGSSLSSKTILSSSIVRTFPESWSSTQPSAQVNLCQKLLFLHQLIQNMTTDCSLNYEFST